jgi:hypothetical protein
MDEDIKRITFVRIIEKFSFFVLIPFLVEGKFSNASACVLFGCVRSRQLILL